MLGREHYYHKTLRKIVVAFGSIFNDIRIIRTNKDDEEIGRSLVPISYGPKEKYITRLTSDPTLTKSIETYVPRISFEMTGLNYDSSRKQVTVLNNFGYGAAGASSQFVPIPYNFDFSVSIFVRNIEDGTQIIEQILPFFTPDYTLTVDLMPLMNRTYDIPVLLNSVNTSVDYEGDFYTTRLIIWDLTFTVRGFIWPSTSTSVGLIEQANTNIKVEGGTPVTNNKVVEIITQPDPLNATPNTTFGFTDTITELQFTK